MIHKESLVFQLSWKVAALCLITFVIGCFFTDPLSWGLGVLVGFTFTVVRLLWLDRTVRNAVTKDEKSASRYARWQYVLRYIVSFAVLAGAALIPQISVYSAMIAMFTLKIATFIQGFFEKKTPHDGSVQFETWVDEEEEEKEQDWDRWQTYNLKARKRLEKKGGRLEKVSQQTVEQAAENEAFVQEQKASGEVMEDQISLFDDQ
ncbi:MAG: ATP synthase subunit I [Firmicutes bacterium]|nr:ATP synthase subunit I [Bacillota bacterium]